MKKLVSLLLCIATVLSLCSSLVVFSSAKTAVKTGRFNGSVVVYLNKDSKGKYQNAKVKICSFSATNIKNNATIHIKLYDLKNKYICEFDTTSGSKINLGNDHSGYKIVMSAKQKSGNSISTQSWNWTNLGKCYYWSVDATSNCHF
ncbi:MAG: hypothetical protein MJ168_01620 [Clostridia bacterium]|nr:hypothetical protein [Clostridia bacterium]